MFDIVLFEPEIPPNTGNIIRLCANTGARLHLVAPLGFSLNHRRLKRAGLDYREYATLTLHPDWKHCAEGFSGRRVFAISTRGGVRFSEPGYRERDVFVFGPETRGLPSTILDTFAPQNRLRLPMLPGSRSLNLSNAVTVIIYEAWRQNGFAGGV
ncbi:MAG: tRNA (uridine(34)/cytosine(34)/5-carboxymethylaminomethyluridine(34)-2'-O)-methyltransferase TrmL [Burkholderiales bacterium]